ncbi:MAG: CDP-glucose 4,6-dehydratase [Cellulomonadaceae bacterium]|jgi:CDP-glucose 4,6-dehydratase|nr:CDP-glucose 4,6-dehydratase [Cellulomonadaceae bacterium]
MHFLVTGHTGFKGAWLSLILASRGHDVSGIALDPLPGGVFERAQVTEVLRDDLRIDIRDAQALKDAVTGVGADVVLHLAAQPLVRESYRIPRETYETNAMGTYNVLEAIAATPQTQADVIITTDKVYRNVGQLEGYVESDSLGGDDPYSASKAMADILTQSWVKSFPGVPTAIARAGNVIGGGDVSKDRLVVDLVNGFASGEPVHIRMPDAVRPWQHVLDCLSGYLSVADALLAGEGTGAWNFGPDPGDAHTVRELADTGTAWWGDGAAWVDDSGDHPHEAALLTLDPTKAQTAFGWRNAVPFPASLEWTLQWEKAVRGGADARQATLDQINAFISLTADAPWLGRF